jgi:large subunit ribosomal protein L6
MSRIGRAPVAFDPAKVKVEISDHRLVVTRLKDDLASAVEVHPQMRVSVADDRILVERPSESKQHKSLHGLTRTLIANAVEGLTSGFRKVLEVYGMGYRVVQDGRNLVMQLGFSHGVEVHPQRREQLPDEPDSGGGLGQAEGGRVRRKDKGRAQARALQGQGHSLPGRAGQAQGRQGRQGHGRIEARRSHHGSRS